MRTLQSQSEIRIDVLELVQNLMEQPEFTPQLIALMDDDLQAPMTALARAVSAGNQPAATAALEALTVALEG